MNSMSRRPFLLGSTAAVLGLAAHRGRAQPADAPLAASPDFIYAGRMLGPGPRGRCDDFRLGGPVVRWDESLKLWRMWYYSRRSDFPAGVAPAFGTGSIALAHSADGLRWSRIDGALVGGAVFGPAGDERSFDALHVATGDVLRHDGAWWMYYFAGNREMPSAAAQEYSAPGFLLRIGLARSRDGLAWERVAGRATGGALFDVVSTDAYNAFPNVFHDGRRFVMQYTTCDKQGIWYRSRVATSTDGVDWTQGGDVLFEDEPGMFETGGMITRDVVRDPRPGARGWLMVYTAKDGRTETGARRSIAAAESADGLSWRRLFGAPILTIGRQGSWDSSGVAAPHVAATRDELRIYYYGWGDRTFTGQPLRGIGCARAPLADLRAGRRVGS